MSQEAGQAQTPPVASVLFLRRCEACGQKLAFVRTASGKAAPMEIDADGNVTTVNHFTTCPEARRFSRRGSKG